MELHKLIEWLANNKKLVGAQVIIVEKENTRKSTDATIKEATCHNRTLMLTLHDDVLVVIGNLDTQTISGFPTMMILHYGNMCYIFSVNNADVREAVHDEVRSAASVEDTQDSDS